MKTKEMDEKQLDVNEAWDQLTNAAREYSAYLLYQKLAAPDVHLVLSCTAIAYADAMRRHDTPWVFKKRKK